MKKIKQTKKALQTWWKKHKANNEKFANALHKIWLGMFLFMCLSYCGCGTTKLTATIHQPQDGTQNTITITTNTPISTDVQPNTNVEFKTTK